MANITRAQIEKLIEVLTNKSGDSESPLRDVDVGMLRESKQAITHLLTQIDALREPLGRQHQHGLDCGYCYTNSDMCRVSAEALAQTEHLAER
jgi:hypothetical protein